MTAMLVVFPLIRGSQEPAIQVSLPLALLLILTQFGYAVSRDKVSFPFLMWPNSLPHTIFPFVEIVPLNVELEASTLVVNAALSQGNTAAEEGLCTWGTCAK